MGSELRSLTSGEIAKYCNVNLRTVIRWLESGKLKGYKLPGRGNNRVLITDFIDFLKHHKMPIPNELGDSEDPAVLIVDDELSMAKAIQRLARKAGVRSIIADNGFHAGLMLSAHKPQMMTLDLSMPGLDGFGVISYTRSQEAFKDMKIIVVSALDQASLDKAISMGANKAYSKPFEPTDLMAEFEALVGNNRQS
ncbi:MAG: response regulator [Paraglaciecola sp.]|uniref:response regulator n=1 Tax=Pseudomonadati TaxID=3379134 RepID=UPI00273D379E|nr:response regulator [Paraglaciecola sp.]MDP5029082.1 response regulator [Paraglaciecola sp.]MDP5131175.1 response regulator [Paraglaciecola sp.]